MLELVKTHAFRFSRNLYWPIICAVSTTIPRKASFRGMASEGEVPQIMKNIGFILWVLPTEITYTEFTVGTALRNKTFEKTSNNQIKARAIKDLFECHVQCRFFRGFTIAHSHYGCRWLIKDLDFVFYSIWDQTKTIYSCFPGILHGLSIAVNPYKIPVEHFKKRLYLLTSIYTSL